MDVIERIKSHLASAPVVLFMKGTPDFPQCGFSAQTVGALRASGASFSAVNIFEDPELREALKRHSNWPTYPQLYVGGELVGEQFAHGHGPQLASRGGLKGVGGFLTAGVVEEYDLAARHHGRRITVSDRQAPFRRRGGG